ncbi:MAG: PDZ domain-containing protein [Thermoanaerobaculales bacterium]
MKIIRSLSQVVRPLLVLACLSLQGCSSLLTSFGGGMSPDLRQNGVSAPAKILEIWDTGWTINDDPVIGMKVEVQPADRPVFEATIKKTTVSRIAVSQFQPGNIIPVRFDPKDPTVVAVDFEGAERPTSSSGNPYHDRFVPASPRGAVFLPPPTVPQLYLGTSDSATDALALFENDYALLGAAKVEDGSNPQQALEQGKQIGAALVVVYGHFIPPAGLALDVLPFHRPSPDPGEPAASVPADASAMLPGTILGSGLGPNDQFATYWGKTQPPILGIVSRPLNDLEQAQLQRKDGLVVAGVANGSPAAAARIVAGDIIVAIDGKPLPDVRAVPALITSLAGQSVRIDLIRNGSAMSVTAQLNPASP